MISPMTGVAGAAQRWAEQLGGWGIPDEILAQASESPWSMPPGLFRAEPEPLETPSRDRALEALPPGGTAIDVGCGAGRAGLSVAPPAGQLVGVDVAPGMLAMFAEEATARGVALSLVRGMWPDVAMRTPPADLVLSYHVAYNVAELGPFALALGAHATRRVVMELSDRHPLSWLGPLWRRFWDLDRPDGPSADDALDVLAEAGIQATSVEWEDTSRRGTQVLTRQERVAFVRARLCLSPQRDAEVAEALDAIDMDAPRRVRTIWWDSEL